MESRALQTHLPTLAGYLDRREKRLKNQLPKHLRPRAVWPIAAHIVLNFGILATLCTVMWNKEEYLTESGPAIAMVVCLLLLIYAFISAGRLKLLHSGTGATKWVRFNFWLMITALLSWPACVAVYLP